MGLFNTEPEYGAVEITEEWLNSGKLTPLDEVNEGLYIMPHEEDGGLNVGKSLLTSLHQPDIERSGLFGRKNQPLARDCLQDDLLAQSDGLRVRLS
jgi:hypothetical protein